MPPPATASLPPRLEPQFPNSPLPAPHLPTPHSVQNGKWVILPDEGGVEIEEEVETPFGFLEVDVPGHDEVGGVVVAF